MLLRELLNRTGEGKAAVVGWGRGMGHKGHMMLASSVITQANETDADPYFVVSRTVGKDDPITPDEKMDIYKKVFPKHGHIFHTATDEMPDLTRVLTKLAEHGYTDVTVVVGADQVKALSYVKNYNGKANKAGDVPYSFNTLNVIARQETNDPSREEEGPRATPMRSVLMDPKASEEEKFAAWRDAMSPELSDDEVRELMAKAQARMSDPAFGKKPKAVAEDRENYNGVNLLLQKDDDELFVKASAGGRELGHVLFVIDGEYLMPQDLEVEERYRGQGIAQTMYDYVKSKGYKIRRSGQQTDAGAGFWDKHKGQGQNVWEQGVAEGDLMEGPELASTLKHIVDNGKYITQVYDNLKQMAKKFVDNRGDLKGFAMMAGGVGSRWYNDFYFNKLQTELYALTKQAPKYAADLHEFLKGASEDRDRKISFTEISRSLPAILYKMGQRMGNKELSHFAASWNNRRQDYEAYLDQIEAEAGMDDDSGYYEPSVKPERDHTSGKQNAQADVLINQAIKDHIPARHQGEIRNMINKLPMNSRFAALEKAINKFKAVEEEAAGVGLVTKQNTTADVGPGTLGKMLRAFKL